MTTHYHLFIFILVPFVLLTAADDSAVMFKLLSSLSPPPFLWSSSAHFCNWANVACDSTYSSVISINLDAANVSGSLPPQLNQLSQLETLSLENNSLTGTLPSFENMTSLMSIYLDNNSFSSIPNNFLFGLTSLQIFSISNNINLAPWQIPTYLIESTALLAFYASNAGISGTIPDIFGSFPSLENLTLSYNNLTGSLPGSFSGSEIQILWLQNQQSGLSGGIDVLATMAQLSQVLLNANAFTGGIPDLSNCTKLFDLQLSDNRFTGVIPSSLMYLPKLVNISLQNNLFQGPYPQFPSRVRSNIGTTNRFCLSEPGPCDPQVTTLLEIAGTLGYPMALADSWEGNNACRGWMFITCDRKNVTIVNMGRQGFSGSISSAFANLISLRSLMLNDNNLFGVIPNELTALPQLHIIDVSNNNLSGPIPVFLPGVTFDHDGNLLLGKNAASGSGGNSGATGSSRYPDNSSNGSSKRSISVAMVFGVVFVVVFVGILLFLSYKYYFKKIRQRLGNELAMRKEVQSQRDGEIPIFGGINVAISMQVVKQVTNNFSEENVLGRGGFGVVYKGELQDGTKIAVKRMECGAMGAKVINEFQAEIDVLSKVRHRHLVHLLGYCMNDTERLLVYEYMPMGNLSQHLFKWQEHDYQPLTWKQRMRISLDVARGVEYLHSLAQECFIHRDLKPSNILLTDELRAKVADFGLVKNTPNGKYSISTRVAGTFGYLAPEYASTGRVTAKVDVFAFGVVLMEIITGRKVVDDSVPDDDTPHLVTWFRRIIINKGDLRKAIDPILNPEDETYESICKAAELACHCTAHIPYQRPDMGYVVNLLGQLVEHWKPSKPGEHDMHTSLPSFLERWEANCEGTSSISDDLSYGKIVVRTHRTFS